MSNIESNLPYYSPNPKKVWKNKVNELIKKLNEDKQIQETLKNFGENSKLKNALSKFNEGQDKLKNAVESITKIDYLKSASGMSSRDKWETINTFNSFDDKTQLDQFLGQLNSRSIVAFQKKAAAENKHELSNRMSNLIAYRGRSVQESISNRTQVNFRLSAEETKKIENIKKWLDEKGKLSLLNQTLVSEFIKDQTSLAKSLLEFSIEYLHIAYLNEKQLDILAKMIVDMEINIEGDLQEEWAQICEEGYPTDEEGAPVNFEYFSKVERINMKKRIVEAASIIFNTSEKLITDIFWIEAQKKAAKIIKTIKDGPPLDKDASLRAKIFNEFNSQ